MKRGLVVGVVITFLVMVSVSPPIHCNLFAFNDVFGWICR